MNGFDHKRSAHVFFSLYEYGSGGLPHPRDIYRQTTPPPNRTEWVPQTVIDGISVYYEFASADDRDAFLRSPPAAFSKASIGIPTPEQLEHWTKRRGEQK